MTDNSRSRPWAEEIANQSPPYQDVDLYCSDRPLQEAIAANGGGDTAALSAFGIRWGTADMFDLAYQANESPPKLERFDARGFRRDVVLFHPAYHHFMRESIAAGLHASTWSTEAAIPAAAPAQVTRAARFYMAAQVETGHLCPITMTRASVAALAVEAELAAKLVTKIISRVYDCRFAPWWQKSGMTLGMGMTERQGGTDVRTNTTRAERTGEGYAITGHKWFMSAPMCDAFLVLAQAQGGLTCFLMPRFRPDGSVNALHFQRLKDKLGNRSNASSEVEFDHALAWRVGEEGRGVRTILQMVQLTRLDCAIASVGIMRMALAQAIHHARHRSVFQKRLADQPMMQTVLADMALVVEAATALVMRLARSFDHARSDPHEAARARLLTPAVKYWVCKTAPGFIYEAMECVGGNGYVEESTLPRLYREAPVNAIWEGSGNVMCLDVLRALGDKSAGGQDVLGTLGSEASGLPGARTTLDRIQSMLSRGDGEARARETVDRIALLAAAAALPNAEIADLFARTRLRDRQGSMFGTGDIGREEGRRLLERALPPA
jgi:putative acyl-CoA dehydrogenase